MDSGFQKELDSIFSGFNAFLCTSFSCSNLAILKDVVTASLFFFFRFTKLLAFHADVLRGSSHEP